MKSLSAQFLAELEADIIRPRILFDVELSSGSLCYWNGARDLSWSGNTYLCTPGLTEIDEYRAEGSIDSAGLSVTLAAESSAVLAVALSDVRRNKVGRLWFACVTEAEALAADPDLFFYGLLDKVEISDSGRETSLKLGFERRFSGLERAKNFRYNAETQALFAPADRGFEYVPQLAGWSGYWGKPQT